MRKDPPHRKPTGFRIVISRRFEVHCIIYICLVRLTALRAPDSELPRIITVPEFVTNLLNRIRTVGGVQRKVEMLSVMVEVRCRASLVQGVVDLRLRHPCPALVAVKGPSIAASGVVVTIMCSGLTSLKGAFYELGRTVQRRVEWPCIDSQCKQRKKAVAGRQKPRRFEVSIS